MDETSYSRLAIPIFFWQRLGFAKTLDGVRELAQDGEVMFLLEKGKRPQPICRACGKIHEQEDCPRVRKAKNQRREFVRLIALAKELAAAGAR